MIGGGHAERGSLGGVGGWYWECGGVFVLVGDSLSNMGCNSYRVVVWYDVGYGVLGGYNG